MVQSLYLAGSWVAAAGVFFLGLTRYAKFLSSAAEPQIGWAPLLAGFLMALGVMIGVVSPILIGRSRDRRAPVFRPAPESIVAEGAGAGGRGLATRARQVYESRSDREFS